MTTTTIPKPSLTSTSTVVAFHDPRHSISKKNNDEADNNSADNDNNNVDDPTNVIVVDLTKDYPPVPVVLMTALIDTTCSSRLLPCERWREWMFPGVDLDSVVDGVGADTDLSRHHRHRNSNSNRQQQQPHDDHWFSYKYQLPNFSATFQTYQTVPYLSYQDFLLLHRSDDAKNNNSNNSSSPQSHLALMYRYAFTTPSTHLALLSTPTAITTLLVLVGMIRHIKKQYLVPHFAAYGRRAARKSHGPTWEHVPANQERIAKFGEYVYRLIYHTLISIYGLLLLAREDWWTYPTGTIELYAKFPNHVVGPALTWYYLLQSAYNLDAFVSLIELSFIIRYHKSNDDPFGHRYKKEEEETEKDQQSNGHTASNRTTTTTTNTNDTMMKVTDDNNVHNDDNDRTRERRVGVLSSWIPSSLLHNSLSNFNNYWRLPIITIGWHPNIRGDFREMMVHHVATNMLIVGSSICRFTRIGSMVFLIHDVSDITVDLSKLANFLKWKTTTVVCFLTMVVVWAYTRLYILPFTLYRSMVTQSHYIFEPYLQAVSDNNNNTTATLMQLPVILYVCYRHIFYTLIGLLIALHLGWFGMFLQMFYTLARKNECHDYSEHKNGEEQQPRQHVAAPDGVVPQQQQQQQQGVSQQQLNHSSSNGKHHYHQTPSVMMMMGATAMTPTTKQKTISNDGGGVATGTSFCYVDDEKKDD